MKTFEYDYDTADGYMVDDLKARNLIEAWFLAKQKVDGRFSHGWPMRLISVREIN
jgi:hypothetical protein